MQCPNCDSIRMFSVEPEGDGKCSVCHGSGYGGVREMFFEPVAVQLPECDDCRALAGVKPVSESAWLRSMSSASKYDLVVNIANHVGRFS